MTDSPILVPGGSAPTGLPLLEGECWYQRIAGPAVGGLPYALHTVWGRCVPHQPIMAWHNTLDRLHQPNACTILSSSTVQYCIVHPRDRRRRIDWESQKSPVLPLECIRAGRHDGRVMGWLADCVPFKNTLP